MLSNNAQIDNNNAQRMMEWEKPHMEAVVEKLNPSGDVLEIGFGMGYSANAIQKFDINSHTIIEVDENTLKNLKEWAPLQKHKVNIIEGCWQYHLPSMTQKFDCFFFDDYPHPEYPCSADQNVLYFFHQIVQKNVKRGAKFSFFCSDFFTNFPCSVFMRWDMYKFAADVPNAFGHLDYKNVEQMLVGEAETGTAHNIPYYAHRTPIYFAIINFNADSSEMGGWAWGISYGKFKPI